MVALVAIAAFAVQFTRRTAELVAVSEATTWDFSQLASNTESALYNSKDEGIKLDNTTTPSQTDEVVYSDAAAYITANEGFNTAAIAFKGQYPIRKNKYCQNGELHFKAGVAGKIVVSFNDTGSTPGNDPTKVYKRYLLVNNTKTEYWTSREYTGEGAYAANMNITTGEIEVPAGDVTISGVKEDGETAAAIQVSKIVFTPTASPEPAQVTSTYVFTAKNWTATKDDVAANWTSGKDGAGFSNNGVQVTTTVTGASATSPDEYDNITKIVVTYNTNKSKGAGTFDVKIGTNDVVSKNWAYSSGDGTAANYTLEYDYDTPQSGAVTITANTTTNSIYVVSVAITHDAPAPPAVEKPKFSVAGGEYIEAQSVELTCDTEGAEIFYALNDATEYTKYTAAISVTETTTIKAYAQKGEDKSAEATATYTIVTPLTVAEVIAAIDGGTAGNCYVQGFVSKVDSYNETYKSITYWISADGTTEGQQFEVYSGKGLNGADFTSVDEVKVGAAVVVYGYAKKFNDTYEFDKNNKLVKYEAPALQGTVFDYAAAGAAGETLTKVNLNFQVNMGEGKEDRTDRNFRGYKDYTGINLPAECQVATGEEQKVDENGLIVGQDRYLAVYGLHTGDKVAIYYTGVPEGKQPTYCPGTSVDTKAKIGSTELVSTTSAINSGDVIEITKAGSKNYIIMSIFNGMRISKVVIQKAALYDVTIAEGIENGSVKVSAAKAAAGDEVTVTATPTEFFKLDAITVKDAEDADVTITDGKFTMPAKAVTVSASFVIDPSVVVFDYAAAGVAGETLTKVNLNFQVNMGEGKEDRTDRNFRGYKDYTGINLPAECQVATGEEQKVDENGLIVGQDRYLAVYGLHTGDKVAIYYTGVPEGKQPTYCPGTSVDTKAKIGSTELVSTTSAINSGDVIEITKAGSKNYIIMSIFNGMRISKVVIQKAALYDVTIAEGLENGSVKVSAAKAAAGDEVVVTATPAEGYVLDAVTVMNGETAVTVTDGKFTMPAANVIVSATFKLGYKITAVNAEGITITPEVAYAAEGEKVYATYTLSDGYQLDKPEFVDDNGDEIAFAEGQIGLEEVGGVEKMFIIMPAKNVTIIAKASKKYQIALNLSQENGNATCLSVNKEKPETAFKKEGDKIYLAINPDAGYEAVISVKAGEDDVEVTAEAGTYDEQQYTHFFTMPASAVTVTVAFKSATGINSIAADKMKNATIYNMKGQRVDKAQKGLYIINGKKVMIK